MGFEMVVIQFIYIETIHNKSRLKENTSPAQIQNLIHFGSCYNNVF